MRGNINIQISCAHTRPSDTVNNNTYRILSSIKLITLSRSVNLKLFFLLKFYELLTEQPIPSSSPSDI